MIDAAEKLEAGLQFPGTQETTTETVVVVESELKFASSERFHRNCERSWILTSDNFEFEARLFPCPTQQVENANNIITTANTVKHELLEVWCEQCTESAEFAVVNWIKQLSKVVVGFTLCYIITLTGMKKFPCRERKQHRREYYGNEALTHFL